MRVQEEGAVHVCPRPDDHRPRYASDLTEDVGSEAPDEKCIGSNAEVFEVECDG